MRSLDFIASHGLVVINGWSWYVLPFVSCLFFYDGSGITIRRAIDFWLWYNHRILWIKIGNGRGWAFSHDCLYLLIVWLCVTNRTFEMLINHYKWLAAALWSYNYIELILSSCSGIPMNNHIHGSYQTCIKYHKSESKKREEVSKKYPKRSQMHRG